MGSKFAAFIAGHIPSYKSKNIDLYSELVAVYPGISKVTIPNNVWSGYGFVEFRNQTFLEAFLKLRAISIHGYEISIKPMSDGSKLQSLKEDYNSRRLFVRIRAKREVRPDLHAIFSEYG